MSLTKPRKRKSSKEKGALVFAFVLSRFRAVVIFWQRRSCAEQRLQIVQRSDVDAAQAEGTSERADRLLRELLRGELPETMLVIEVLHTLATVHPVEPHHPDEGRDLFHESVDVHRQDGLDHRERPY